MRRPRPLLEVVGLVKHFRSGGLGRHGRLQALNGVGFSIQEGETLALVGESGCGKTTLARTIVGLYRPDEGAILYKGEKIALRRGRALKSYRRAVQMIFQDPFGSLNPRLPVSSILAEPLVIHRVGDRHTRYQRVLELADMLHISRAQLHQYAHEFSGGQRQRIAMARALALEPELIVADEPLSALDVSLQAQILEIFSDLKKEKNLATLFITHDLAVVDSIADRVAVMYLGRIVEIGRRTDVFNNPAHPYTRALIASVPVLGRKRRRKARRPAISGDVPNPLDPPAGCAFHPRCPWVVDSCRTKIPRLRRVGEQLSHLAACPLRNKVAAARFTP